MLELWNRHTQQMEPADLIGRIQLEDVTSFEKRWLPPMQAKLQELKLAGKLTAEEATHWNVADGHWQWPAKVRDRVGQLQWASYALRCGGDTQGLMFVNLLRRCRLPVQLNQHMVYVDLVSTAPWNRPRLTPKPLYGGVGVIMVTEAIIRSLDEGFDGRIGLHALHDGHVGRYKSGPLRRSPCSSLRASSRGASRRTGSRKGKRARSFGR